jgi:hypothetical protein
MTRSQRSKTSKGIIGLMLGAGLLLSVGCPDENGSGGSGDAHVKVFLSSASYDGIPEAGGFVGADDACTTLAAAAGLTGSWTAWLSDNATNAIDRIFDGGGASFRLVNGTVIADNLADLIDGSLDAPIGIFENGGAPGPGAVDVWTGTGTDGTFPGTSSCVGWTTNSNANTGQIGKADSATATWTNAGGGQGCELFNRLYCFANAVSN